MKKGKKNGPYSRVEIIEFKRRAEGGCERYMRWNGVGTAYYEGCYYKDIKDKCRTCQARAILKAVGRPILRRMSKSTRRVLQRYELLRRLLRRSSREAT